MAVPTVFDEATGVPADFQSDIQSPWRAVAIVVAFVFLVRLPGMVPSVVDWDESAYILMARELLHGHIPYTTMFDDKPVGGPAIFALVMAIFGQSVLVIRLLGCLSVIATALLLRATVLRAGLPRPAGLAAAILYGAFTSILAGLASNTELLFAPCTAAAVFVAVSSANACRWRQQAQTIATCGAFFGLAIWIKTVAALPAIALFALLVGSWVWQRRLKPLAGVGLAAIYVAACALPMALTALVYWSRGDLALWLYSNFGFMSAYLSSPPIRSPLLRAAARLTEIWLLLVLAGWGAVSCLRGPASRERNFVLAMIVWVVAESAAVIAPWKFFDHYFLILLAPLSILSGLALARIADRTVFARFLPIAAPTMALALSLVPLATWMSVNSFNFRRSDAPRQVATIIRQNSSRSSAWVVNSQPIIYFLADIPLPTRFPFPPHLVGFDTGYTHNDPSAEVSRLLAARLTFIVVDESTWATVAPAIQPLIRAALARDYELAERILPNGSPANVGTEPNTNAVDVFRLKGNRSQSIGAKSPSTP